MLKALTLAVPVLALAACASTVRNQVDLMPAPDVFGDGLLNPLPEQDPMALIPYGGLLYATDRLPATGTAGDSF